MTDAKRCVLEKLFAKPEYHFHIRELAREINLHPNTVITITDQLEQEGVVVKKKNKHLVEIYCNHDSTKYKYKKQLLNLSLIFESGLVEKLIEYYHHPKAVILFGSFLRGEDISSSDVDIAVISSEKKKFKVEPFGEKIKRNIHLLVFDYKEISNELYNNLINGFVLYGFLKDERIRKVSG